MSRAEAQRRVNDKYVTGFWTVEQWREATDLLSEPDRTDYAAVLHSEISHK